MLWIAGLVFTLTKGKLVHVMGTELCAPDLVTIGTAYIFMKYGHTGACIFALGQGLFIDLLSGGMHGLFTFLYLIVLGGIWLVSRFFNLQSLKGQFVIISLTMILKKMFLFLMLVAFSQEFFFPQSFLWGSIWLIVYTGLMAPVSFYFFNLVKSIIIEDSFGPSKEQM